VCGEPDLKAVELRLPHRFSVGAVTIVKQGSCQWGRSQGSGPSLDRALKGAQPGADRRTTAATPSDWPTPSFTLVWPAMIDGLSPRVSSETHAQSA
jgi:hypothetical protein